MTAAIQDNSNRQAAITNLLLKTKRLAAAEEKKNQLHAEWCEAVYVANRSGVSYQELANLTGKSYPRIDQVIRAERKRRGELA